MRNRRVSDVINRESIVGHLGWGQQSPLQRYRHSPAVPRNEKM